MTNVGDRVFFLLPTEQIVTIESTNYAVVEGIATVVEESKILLAVSARVNFVDNEPVYKVSSGSKFVEIKLCWIPVTGIMASPSVQAMNVLKVPFKKIVKGWKISYADIDG